MLKSGCLTRPSPALLKVIVLFVFVYFFIIIIGKDLENLSRGQSVDKIFLKKRKFMRKPRFGGHLAAVGGSLLFVTFGSREQGH